MSYDFMAVKGPRGATLTKEYCSANPGRYPVYSGQTENAGVLGSIDNFDFSLGSNGGLLTTTVGAKAMSLTFVVGNVSLSQNCMLIRPLSKEVFIKFYFYHLQPLFRLERGMIPDHMQPSFRMEDLYSFHMALPPLQEQTQIARFLDHETAKIDTLIHEQKRLIELLKEKRQAVISHAVTKGLDPDVPMKDSGVEWLGEVPAHWVVKPLRYLSRLIDGDRSSAYPSEDDLVDEGIPFVSSKNIVDYKLTNKNLNFITVEKFNSLSRGKLCDGDLVITVRGTIGHVAVFSAAIIGNDTGFINAQMMIIRPVPGLTEYIRLCSESTFWQKQLEVAAYGATVKQLSNLIVGGILIALPPKNKMSALISKVNELEQEFNLLITEATLGTKLLQERRSALISAAVTGKIDVRNWQPPADESAFEEVAHDGQEAAV
ncbi:MAG: restriction endonuclease subunit S [Marinobacter sp.]